MNGIMGGKGLTMLNWKLVIDFQSVETFPLVTGVFVKTVIKISFLYTGCVVNLFRKQSAGN